MARNARHISVTMRQCVVILRHITPRRIVLADGFRVTRVLAVVASSRNNRVHSLAYAPPTSGDHHRILHDVTSLQINISAGFVLPFSIAGYLLEKWDLRARLIAHPDACEVLAQE